MPNPEHITYQNGAKEECSIRYLLEGGKCTFCGTGRSNHTNPEWDALLILSAIAAHARLANISNIQWFELGTHRAYPAISTGQHQYRQLSLIGTGADMVVREWVPAQCPHDTLQAFREFLGEAAA
jgi:hypothetical protein